MPKQQSRRAFLTSASAAALAGMGVGGAVGGKLSAGKGTPETTTIRLKKSLAICFAPYYIVEDFLREEGFKDIKYLESFDDAVTKKMLKEGELNFDQTFAGQVVHEIDSGEDITALGGLHVGCYELFAREPIRTIGDLKGKRVGINEMHLGEHLYISIMAAYVGLDPKKDIKWVTSKTGPPLELFAAGETDAFLGFPPEPQMLRARGHKRVILNTVQDHPWSQYFCCMMYGNRSWVRNHPVATKKFLRAMYRASAVCSSKPESAARQLVDGKFAERYDYALETIKAIPYDLWHEYDSDDTMRFYALRLHDAGMLKNNPKKILEEGTQFNFLKDLRHEMRG